MLVIGCGRVGSAVALELKSAGWEVTVIDEAQDWGEQGHGDVLYVFRAGRLAWARDEGTRREPGAASGHRRSLVVAFSAAGPPAIALSRDGVAEAPAAGLAEQVRARSTHLREAALAAAK